MAISSSLLGREEDILLNLRLGNNNTIMNGKRNFHAENPRKEK
jgi:hypothetical protein